MKEYNSVIPWVIEKTPYGERQYDIFSRLLKDRIIFLGTEINDQVANAIIAELLFLEADDPERDINLYINSPGGEVTAGLAIYDTIQFIKAPVSTICVGQAASMAAVLLASGSNKKKVHIAKYKNFNSSTMGRCSRPSKRYWNSCKRDNQNKK